MQTMLIHIHTSTSYPHLRPHPHHTHTHNTIPHSNTPNTPSLLAQSRSIGRFDTQITPHPVSIPYTHSKAAPGLISTYSSGHDGFFFPMFNHLPILPSFLPTSLGRGPTSHHHQHPNQLARPSARPHRAAKTTPNLLFPDESFYTSKVSNSRFYPCE